MHLLFAVRGLFPDFVGGSHRHSKSLISNLALMDGLYIDVIHPTPTKHFAGIPTVNEIHVPYGANIYTYSRNVSRYLEEHGRVYDVAYADGFSLWLYLRNRRFPCIFNHHGFHFSQRSFFGTEFAYAPGDAVTRKVGDWIRERIAIYNARHADYVVSECESVTKILIERYHCDYSKILQIPVAVSLSEMNSSHYIMPEKGRNSLLFVGGLEFRKGLTYLLDAFHDLDCAADLFIIGDGPLRPYLESKVDSNHIHFLGRVDDEELKAWYNTVDGFVFSGLAESGPIVVLEAMAAGLPIIATDVGAVQTMIKGNGFVVPPGDSNAMRMAVNKLLSLDDVTRRHMGEVSQTIVKAQFDWKRIVLQYYSEFERISEGFPQGPGLTDGAVH